MLLVAWVGIVVSLVATSAGSGVLAAAYVSSAAPGSTNPCAAYALPWTHALGIVRYALMGDAGSRLSDIWGLHSVSSMVALSFGVLLVMACAAIYGAIRTFDRATTV